MRKRAMKPEATAGGERPRCVIYVRTAVHDPAAARRQRDEAIAFLRMPGGETIALEDPVYEDIGVSGNDLDRPGLARLLADAEAGRFEVVVVTDVARLARSMTLVGKLAQRLEACGVSVSVVPPASVGEGGRDAVAR